MSSDIEDNSKFFFKIGEIEKITGVPANKIRYWTKKYEELNSTLRKNSKGAHKLYHKSSIEIILQINQYLNEASMQINNQRLNQKLSNKFKKNEDAISNLVKVKERLEGIINIVRKS